MQVFISRSQVDEPLAEQLTSELRKAGLQVWSPRELFPGDNWRLETGKALEASDVMVALFSRGAHDSEVARDVQYALTFGKYEGRVIPVLIDFVTFEVGKDVPWVLLRMDPLYIQRSEPDYAEIVRRVQQAAAGSHASA